MAPTTEVDPSTIRSLRETRQVSVRYGRARITIIRFGGLTDGDLGAAIEQFEACELDAEGLAWALVRARVVKHTPTFSWGDAELPLLLDRVVGASTHPKFSSSVAGDVARMLVQTAQEEREAAERLRRRTERWAQGIGAQFDFGFGKRQIFDALKATRQVAGLFPGAQEPNLATAALYGNKGALSVGLGESVTAAARLATAGAVRQDLRDRFAGYAGVGGWNGKTVGVLGGRGLASEQLHIATAGFRAQLPTEQMAAYLRGHFDVPLSFKAGEISSALFPDLTKFQSMFSGHDWLERLKRSYPANWRDLDRDEVDAVVKLMLETGLCLAWAPRVGILREILAAQGNVERMDLLEDRSEQLLEDVEAVLAEISSPSLLPTVQYCREAIAAHEDGHTNPALAYASAALSDLVHVYFGEKDFGPIRAIFRDVDPWNDVGVAEFSFYAVGDVWVRAMVRFEGNEDPGYNRNRTLHLIGDHYREANLAAVLMLLAGLVRELQRFEVRSEARQQKELAAAA